MKSQKYKIIRCIITFLLSLPFIAIIVYGLYFMALLGKTLAFANIVLSDNHNCAFVNSLAAHMYSFFNNQSCVFVMLSKYHIRYLFVGNCTMNVIDQACGDACDNLTYKVWYVCRLGRKLYAVPVGVYRGYVFYELLKKRLEEVCYKEYSHHN